MESAKLVKLTTGEDAFAEMKESKKNIGISISLLKMGRLPKIFQVFILCLKDRNDLGDWGRIRIGFCVTGTSQGGPAKGINILFKRFSSLL